MSDAATHRTLIVANRTAATPQVVEEVERRVRKQPTTFALLIPEIEHKEGDWTLEYALPVLEKAANEPVKGLTGDADPFEAIKAALAEGDFDDVILSTPHHTLAGLLHRDLAHRVKELGVPVMVIEPSAEHVHAPETGTSELAGPLT